jgi:hypothetical protein
MFEIALFVGIYSYLILTLGILGILFKNIIVLITVVYISLIGIYFLRKYGRRPKISKVRIDKLSKILVIILGLQILVNLIGVLGPEISFDALWYHLTLPKIFLENHRIFHIPGGLLYYSDFPKNIEMIFLACLSFGNETLAKFSHLVFGLLTLLTIFKISRKFLDLKFALLSCVIFYSSLVVGWESITAYVDLGTTFFTTVSFYCFLEWVNQKKHRYLISAAIITGLTIATKIVALNLVPIYVILLVILGLRQKENHRKIIYQIIIFGATAVFVALPWLLFSFVNTGNPFYPLFDSKLGVINTFNPLALVSVFMSSQDPINPTYLISLPLIFYYFVKFNFKLKIFFVFFLLSLVFWYLDSQVGGSRFILPYLPILSIVVSYVLGLVKDRNLRYAVIMVIILLSLVSISYRGLANAKYLPVVLGQQSKEVFLSKHLNFSFGDFYDTDGYIKSHIKQTDKVLTYGFHNLYYIDFPFIDSSFAKLGDKFNYIMVQNGNLPIRFSNWRKIYYNNITQVSLYSLGGKQWVY